MKIPACFRSLGVPDFARTSRSTRLSDMSPKVSPDITPAKQTRPAMIKMRMKNSVSQHVYSTAIQFPQISPAFFFFFSFLFSPFCFSSFSQIPKKVKKNKNDDKKNFKKKGRKESDPPRKQTFDKITRFGGTFAHVREHCKIKELAK